jgi:hypothetical protein
MLGADGASSRQAGGASVTREPVSEAPSYMVVHEQQTSRRRVSDSRTSERVSTTQTRAF